MEFIKKPFTFIKFLIYYTFYILIYKNIFKRFYRLITGTHEIERCITKFNNYEKLSKI
jgi:hypothetical protein